MRPFQNTRNSVTNQSLLSLLASFPSHRQEVADSSGHRAQSPDLIMGCHGLPYTRMLPASYAGSWSLCSPNRRVAYANKTDRGYPGYTNTHSLHTHEHICSMHDTQILCTHTYTRSHIATMCCMNIRVHMCTHTIFLYGFKHDHYVLQVYMHPFIHRGLPCKRRACVGSHNADTYIHESAHTYAKIANTIISISNRFPCDIHVHI